VSLSVKFKAYLLKFFTRKKEKANELKNIENVLFLRYDRIGDMIISTPVFRELKLHFPKIKITILASKSNHSVLKNNPYIDEVCINKKNNLLGDLMKLLMLRKKNFDVCIEFDHSVVPHAIIRLKIIKPKIIISVFKDGRYGVEGTELELYDFYTKNKKNIHSRDIWLETLTPFGVKPKSKKYDLFVSKSEMKIAKNFTNKIDKNFLIGINLKGAVKGKKINFSDLKKICEGIYLYDSTIKIIILSDPSDYESLTNTVTKLNYEYVIKSYKTNTILDVAALISQLDLIITPDTSIAHVASTFDRPVITIHEKNFESYKFFSPKSKLSRTIFSGTKNSLEGFSVDSLLHYCFELMEIIKSK